MRWKVLGLLLAASTASAIAPSITSPDFINDDYNQESTVGIHSRGLASYGNTTNTFKVSRYFIRGNFQKGGLQVFATINGFADTHDPSQNYGYILNNINLYDYGAIYRIPYGFFFSLRGASTYRENWDSNLLFMPYTFTLNTSEFDQPTQYIPIHKTGPGIRVGWSNDNFTIGYSQGDFRHNIPTGVLLKYQWSDAYVRFVYLSEFTDSVDYDSTTLQRKFQISGAKVFEMEEGFRTTFLADMTYRQDGQFWFRFEEAVNYYTWAFAFREMLVTQQSALFEASLSKRLEDSASLGFHVMLPNPSRIYLALEINF